MHKFPSIESFAHVYRDAAKGLEVRPKIKLHGTNGGIRVFGSNIVAQSRNNELIGTDNAGFAAWVDGQKDLWLASDIDDAIVFGEWAGPGIQEKDAVTKIAKRAFFVFAIYYPVADLMLTDPERLKCKLHPALMDVHVLPWAGDAVKINYTNAAFITEQINATVEAIGEMDPFIKATFGVEGPGEGLVFMPEQGGSLEWFVRNTFKAKTEAHRVKKSAKAVSTKIDVPTDAVDFVMTFVTEARLQQGLNEACQGSRDPKRTGDFIKWITNDVRKESVVELDEMGYEFGQVAKFVVARAREWFLAPPMTLAA